MWSVSGAKLHFFSYLVSTILCVSTVGFHWFILFILGNIIEKLGHINSILVGLATLSLRFFLYFIITDPLWVLPVEVLSGLGYALPYSAMTAYGAVIAPDCLKGTVQGLIGIAYQGLGKYINNEQSNYCCCFFFQNISVSL